MLTPSRTPLPWSRSCFVCGEENPVGLRARSFLVDGHVELAFVPSAAHAGWSAVTHGGLIATVLDEVMTWAAIVQSDRACFAAGFEVRLRRPLPPGTAVTVRGRCSGSRRGIQTTEASLQSASGELFATATGRYVAIAVAELAAMHHDLVSTPDCWPAEHVFGSITGAGPAGKPARPAGA